MPRKARFSDLPFDVRNMQESEVRKLLDRVIKASQENFDSLSGDQKGIVAEFNRLAQDVAAIAEFLGADTDVEGQTIDITGAGLGSHDELEDVSANDHHNQDHDHTASDGSGTLTNDTHDGFSDYTESTAPATPAANHLRIWAQDVHGRTELYGLADDGYTMQLTADNTIVVRNVNVGSLTKGKAVYVSGSTSTVPQVSYAKADSHTTLPAVGILVETLASNAYGRMQISGHVQGIDTSAWAEGATLYVSATTAGDLTTTAPSIIAGNHAQAVAVVVTSHLTQGVLLLINATEHPYTWDDATSNPAAVGTVADGTELSPARKDHVHPTGAGTPTTSAVGDAAAVGTGPAAAMTNHVHGRESFGASAAAVGTSSGGAAATPSRSDHVHATGAGTPATVSTANAVGTGPAASMTDHVHAHGTGYAGGHTDTAAAFNDVTSDPLAVGTTADGIENSPARKDHVHATGAGTPSTQAFGDAAATGTGPAAAMTDHKHAMPANPVTAHEAAADPHTGYLKEADWNAKGDLMSATADNTPAVLTVGADDTILMADSAAVSGLKWVASATPAAISTAGATGTSDSFTRGDHTHAHEAAHVAHDTIWDAANDYVRGSAADTAVVQAASTATPAAVSTAGSVGTAANPPSADDHVHAHEAAHIHHDTTWAAKGDIIAATANDTAAVVSVGTNGKVLTADSTAASGVSWQTASGGGTGANLFLYYVMS